MQNQIRETQKAMQGHPIWFNVESFPKIENLAPAMHKRRGQIWNQKHKKGYAGGFLFASFDHCSGAKHLTRYWSAMAAISRVSHAGVSII